MTPYPHDPEIARLHEAGHGYGAIADRLGLTQHAVRQSVARQELPPHPTGRDQAVTVKVPLATWVRLAAVAKARVDTRLGPASGPCLDCEDWGTGRDGGCCETAARKGEEGG